MHLKKGTIHDLDERFCVYSKMTLEFLIRDLRLKIMKASKSTVKVIGVEEYFSQWIQIENIDNILRGKRLKQLK